MYVSLVREALLVARKKSEKKRDRILDYTLSRLS